MKLQKMASVQGFCFFFFQSLMPSPVASLFCCSMPSRSRLADLEILSQLHSPLEILSQLQRTPTYTLKAHRSLVTLREAMLPAPALRMSLPLRRRSPSREWPVSKTPSFEQIKTLLPFFRLSVTWQPPLSKIRK